MYMPTVGQKFHQDGAVRTYPGNTIICFVDPDSAVYRLSVWVQDELRNHPILPKISLLPATSLHMTVFQLLVDEVRQPEKWSRFLPLTSPLAETDAFLLRTVPQVETPPRFRMRYKRLKTEDSGISIRLQPADVESRMAIQQYRDALAEATGVRFPDHDSYEFHISLAYHIQRRSPEEDAELSVFAARIDDKLHDTFGIFDTGTPTLTFFDDMFRFVPAAERHTLQSRQDESS